MVMMILEDMETECSGLQNEDTSIDMDMALFVLRPILVLRIVQMDQCQEPREFPCSVILSP